MLAKFKTYQMALELYRACQDLKPKGPIKDQLARASLSIVLNISEGSGKPSPKEKKHFYGTALGSLREVTTILDILDVRQHERLIDQLGACLYTLSRK
jgi:four helix bundle protein